jgi:acetylornithine/N-succinyldiaminopimelate aminotransferase
MTNSTTIEIEDKHTPPFFKKIPISIERGEGVQVWDETGKRYLDFTSGWGVTCLGHAHPAITDALLQQSQKIIQNPNSGATYSPTRTRLLSLMQEILPSHLTRVFFTNSGAEANDAAIKLARKVTGRLGCHLHASKLPWANDKHCFSHRPGQTSGEIQPADAQLPIHLLWRPR